MKKLWISLLFLLLCSQVFAHPMGSFSISHYSRLQFAPEEIRIEYIIDMAEIPSYQEMDHLDANHDENVNGAESRDYAQTMGNQFIRYLRLQVNGKPASLKLRKSQVEIRPGAGELYTVVISCTYSAEYPAELTKRNDVRFVDENYPMRSGWREIVIDRDQGFGSFELKPDEYTDRSRKLAEYPQDIITTMPQEIVAEFIFNPMDVPASIAAKKSGTSSTKWGRSIRDDSFTKLIATKELTGKIILVSLAIAFLLGSMHALSPGHGKAIVAGYLIGSRGTAYHAVFLGAIVTLTHTIGVFALGLITLFGSKYILPERLYPWLGLFSGVAIVCIGSALFLKRYRSYKHQSSAHHHHQHRDHDHHHDHKEDHHHADVHDHHHDHGHSHLPVDQATGKITWKSLLTIGISGGALPCPSALVVLLSAISLHRIGFGLLLIVAFSLGLALVLTSIGLLFVYASRFTRRFQFAGKFAYSLPLISSFVITVLGGAIALQSFMQI